MAQNEGFNLRDQIRRLFRILRKFKKKTDYLDSKNKKKRKKQLEISRKNDLSAS